METLESILEVAREVTEEDHPADTRIARLAKYVKENLESMNIGGQQCPHRATCAHGQK